MFLDELCLVGLGGAKGGHTRDSPHDVSPHHQNEDKYYIFSDVQTWNCDYIILVEKKKKEKRTTKTAHTETVPYLSLPTSSYSIYNFQNQEKWLNHPTAIFF